jgi:hypothetical protein
MNEDGWNRRGRDEEEQKRNDRTEEEKEEYKQKIRYKIII